MASVSEMFGNLINSGHVPEDRQKAKVDHFPDAYTDHFTKYADEEMNDEMSKYVVNALGDNALAVKLLVDADRNLLCAVMVGTEGSSYYFDRDDRGWPATQYSPISNIDLAMRLTELQRNHTIVTWGGLTAEFRLMYESGLAQDEWAAIAAQHIDMLYHLRTFIGNKLNLQMACQNLGITAVEQNSRSFRIEEAIKAWKEGDVAAKAQVLESLRAYCKLMLAVYGKVAQQGFFEYRQPDNARVGIEYGKEKIELTWARVWQVYNDRWLATDLSKTTNNEAYATVGVMHNWLVAHADRSKKKLQQLVPPTSTLKDLRSNKF